MLTAVNAGNLDGFHAFAEDLAEPLPDDPAAIVTWVLAQLTTPDQQQPAL